MGLAVGFADHSGVVEDGTAFAGFLIFSIGIMAILVRLDGTIPRMVWLERLGDASYSIYLVHIFAVALLAGIGLRIVGTDLPAAIAIVTLLAIVGGVAIGLMIYRYVETPLQRHFSRAAPAPRLGFG